MKNIFLIISLVFISQMSFGQYGGTIRAVNSSGIADYVYRVGSALRVSDSLAQLKLDSLKAHLPIANGKLSVDSISIKSMPTFSVTATNPSVSTTGSSVPTSATLIGGTDGTNLRSFKTTSSGLLQIDSSVTRVLHDSTTDSRVGVKLLQNPTITNTSFGISGTLPAFTTTPTVNIGTTGTIPVSVSSLPLPTGSSTSALQTTGNTSLSNIDTKLTNGTAISNIATSVKSTTPAGNPTSTNVSSTRQLLDVAIYDNLGNQVTSFSGGGGGGGGTQYPELNTTSPATGNAILGRYLSTSPTLTTGQLNAPALDVNSNLQTNVKSSVLPTGAATETTLSTLNTKIPSNLTVTSTRLLVDPSGVTSPVSLSSVPSHPVTNAGTFATQVTSLPSLPTGSNAIGSITNTSFGISGSLPGFASVPTVNIGTTGTIPVSGTFFQATQPVSIAGTVTTTGGLTDGQLRASAVPVSLASVPSHAVTNAGTFVVQVDSSTQRNTIKVSQLPALPTGANAIGSITNTSFGISGTLPAFATTPTVNIGTGGYSVNASDSSKYRITHKISESALPVGAATESTLSSLNGKVPSGLTVNSNRLAIYSPDSIKVYTTGGFGGGGGGGDASAANQVISNTLLQGIKTADSNVSTIVSQIAEGEHGGIVSYGYDFTEGDIHPFSAKYDNAIGDGEYGIPIALWNQDFGGYNFMQTDIDYHVLTNDRKGSILLQGIKTLDSLINKRLSDSIKVYTTGGFSGGGGGGGTQYSELTTTSPATGTLVLGRYLTTPPTLTNGQMNTPMLDSRGNIVANISNSVPTIASAAGVPTSGYEVYGLVSTTSPSPTTNRNAQLSLTDKGGLRTTLVDLSGNYVDASAGGGSGGMAVLYDSTGSATSMTITNLNSLASSNVNGWQSDKVSNLTSKAIDYKIFVKLTMSNTAPANEKSVYVYACPFYYDGTNWFASSQGTTTLPTGTQGTTTIASPNNLRLLGALNYTTQNMVLQDNFLLSTAFGDRMPDGFSIVIINYTGSAVSASSNIVSYKPINSKNQ